MSVRCPSPRIRNEPKLNGTGCSGSVMPTAAVQSFGSTPWKKPPIARSGAPSLRAAISSPPIVKLSLSRDIRTPSRTADRGRA